MTSVEYVRKICKEKGITVAKLERDLNFSNGYLNPKKMQTLPRERVLLIAEYLDIDEDDIWNAGETPESRIEEKMTLYEEQLLQKFRALPANRQRDVEKLINMFYEEVSP